ncbi:DnaJ domain-containing protein [Candidatus Fermentibacteria bacterium]|nr:DnaJ domain-containing protein [Candidatus Fermentibacteria bacterium]
MTETPHKVLGVAATATPAEIKQAYRRKVLQCHPDTVGSGQEAEFRKIHEAYEALSGNSHGDERVSVCTEPPKRRPWSQHNVTGRPAYAPSDARLELVLDPREAAAGLALSFPVEVEAPCPLCHGTGLFSLLCPVCGGRGTMRYPARAHARVPAGIEHGAIIPATGIAPGIGPVAIDLHVSISGG